MRWTKAGLALWLGGLVVLGGLQPASAAEPEQLELEIRARLDGKPWADAPVRVLEVEATTSSQPEEVGAALVTAHARLRDAGTPTAARCDAKGRATVIVPKDGVRLLRVGKGPEAWTASLLPPLLVPGEPLLVDATSKPLRVALPGPVPAGWHLMAVRRSTAIQGVMPLAFGRAGAGTGPMTLDGMASGVITLGWIHPRHGFQGAHALTARPGDTIVQGRLPHMDAANMLAVIVTVKAPPGTSTSDIRVDVGDRDPRLAGLEPGPDGSFTSGETGGVPLSAYPTLRGLRAHIQAPGCMPAVTELEMVEAVDGARQLVAHVVLEQGQPVTGSAEWADGLAERQRWVQVRAVQGTDPTPSTWFLLRADGTFETWLAPGRWELAPIHDRASAQQIDVGPTGTADVKLPAVAQRTLSGTVVVPRGRSAADARVYAMWGPEMSGHSVRPDKQGRFSMEVPAAVPGGLTLAVSAPRCGMATRKVSNGQTDVGTLELVAGGSVRFEAKDARGEPLEDWGLLPERAMKEPVLALTQAVVDGSGRAELAGIEPGKHTFIVASGDERNFQVSFEVKEGKETRVAVAPPPDQELLVLAPDLPSSTSSEDVVIAAKLGTSLLHWETFVTDDKGHIVLPYPRGADALILLAARTGRLVATSPLRQEDAQPGTASKRAMTPYEPGPWEAVLRIEDGGGRPVYPTASTLIVDTVRPSANPIEQMDFGERVSVRRMFEVPSFEVLRVGGHVLLGCSDAQIKMDLWMPQRGETLRSKRLFLREFVDAAGQAVDLAPAVVDLPAPPRVRVRPALPLRMAIKAAGSPVRKAIVEVQYVLPGDVSYREGELPRVRVKTDALGVATLRDRPQDMDLLVRVVQAEGGVPQAKPVTIAAAQSGTVELTVEKAASVVVTVLDRAGKPVVGVNVYVWDADAHTQRDPRPVATGTTDAEGTCRFEGLSAESRYQIDVEDDRFAPHIDWRPLDTTLRAIR
ncbi:MAG: hypothetical protein AB7T63_04260 [Planctomycetota bacterium]